MLKKLYVLSMFLIIALFVACQEKVEDDQSNIFGAEDQSSCVSCHRDKELLAEIAEPLESGGEAAGEG